MNVTAGELRNLMRIADGRPYLRIGGRLNRVSQETALRVRREETTKGRAVAADMDRAQDIIITVEGF